MTARGQLFVQFGWDSYQEKFEVLVLEYARKVVNEKFRDRGMDRILYRHLK